MARPQTGRKLTSVSTEGVDIVLVLDTSGSMQALDLDADRPIARGATGCEVAKDVVEKFVEKRENDQIGLVVFGDEAFTQCPLTLDHGIVATFLDGVKIGVAGDATAIGSAIGTAVKRLQGRAGQVEGDRAAHRRPQQRRLAGAAQGGRGRQDLRHQDLHHRRRHPRPGPLPGADACSARRWSTRTSRSTRRP